MGEKTGIEWTDKTWNTWVGCRMVSVGCSHCYMFRDLARYGQNPTAIRRTKPATFNAPLRWKESAYVFTCSWSDFFIDRADEWRGDAWKIIKQTPHLIYQILTKRPERIHECLPEDWGSGYPNVWLGVSTENQDAADYRLPHLFNNPAQLYFVSYEPALGQVDFSAYLDPDRRRKIGWIICGGESGPKARSMDLDWARSARDQCVAHGVAFFLKQLGGEKDRRGGKQAVLDGETWTQMPTFDLPEPPSAPEQMSLF